MASVSAIILTKNEEKNIPDCIKSVQWCNEILVVDDYSEDKTGEIAAALGAKVYRRHLNGDFAEQRNTALSKATSDWMLFLDADERVSLSLQYEMLNFLNNPLERYTGFYFKRKDFMWGKELRYGETGAVRLLRLARKNAGKWEGQVHEVWKVHGQTATFKNPLLHYPHPTISDFLREINYYTDVRAQELYKKHVKVQWWDILLYPKAKFIINYVIKRGFLDGIEGFLLALFMSFHSFLVRGKLWYLWQNAKEK